MHGKYSVKDGLGGLDWTTDVAWQRIDDDRITRDFEATDRRGESNSSDLYGSVSLSYDASSDYQVEGWVRFASDQDRLSARDVNDVRIDPQGTPGWVVIGARLQKEYAQHWLLSIALDNLLDKRFRVHGSGLDAPGRNLTISARYNW